MAGVSILCSTRYRVSCFTLRYVANKSSIAYKNIPSRSNPSLDLQWNCVAEFGKMVEIGKRDFIGQGRLAMDPFEANRSFFGVDIAQMCAERPRMIKR